MNVTDNIRAVRKEKGLTQTEVAKRYGTSPEFYHRLEKKDKTLTIEQLEKIAHALNVPITELLSLQDVVNAKHLSDLQSKIDLLEKNNARLEEQNRNLSHSANLLTLVVALISQSLEDGSIAVDKSKKGTLDAFLKLVNEFKDRNLSIEQNPS